MRPPLQQPEIGVWLDRIGVGLEPEPPPKKLEVEWVLIAGIAAGLVLLLSGSIYWFSGNSSKKYEPVLVAASRTSVNAPVPALVIDAPAPPKENARLSEALAGNAKVPRVTEEAPTLPVEKDSRPALRAATKAPARAMAAALTGKKPDRADSTDRRIADTNSTPDRAKEPKSEEPKVPRSEPTPASARPQPAKPAAAKLALAEPLAAPIPSEAAAPTPSIPAPVIAMPRLKFMRAPNYPVSEMRAGHNGTTTLELLVLESGLVGEATVLSSSGYPKLDAAAVAVVKRSWKFFPATEDGKPMPMKIQAPIRFSLD